jgi:hypothetical protein
MVLWGNVTSVGALVDVMMLWGTVTLFGALVVGVVIFRVKTILDKSAVSDIVILGVIKI